MPGHGDASTFAVTVGTGSTAVIMLHEAGADHCSWMPIARLLATKGVQAWSLDSAEVGGGESIGDPIDRGNTTVDVVRVARYARAHGATRIVVAGASMGATAVIAAAADAKAARVVALSAPSVYNVDAVAAIHTLHVPVLLMVGVGDTEFVPSAEELLAAAPAGTARLVRVYSGAHGTALLGADLGTSTVLDTVVSFLLEPDPTATSGTTASGSATARTTT